MSFLSSRTCALMWLTHLYISSHRPLKTSSHPAVHAHVSPILTCCIVENPSEVVPSFPFWSSRGMQAFSGEEQRRGRIPWLRLHGSNLPKGVICRISVSGLSGSSGRWPSTVFGVDATARPGESRRRWAISSPVHCLWRVPGSVERISVSFT